MPRKGYTKESREMPGTYFGPYSEQYSDYPAEGVGNVNLGRWPLGHTLILPDAREYKFTLNDGTVEIAGNLYQSVAALTGHTNRLVAATTASGATAVAASITTTVAAADIYAEGIVHVNDLDGEGYAYRIQRAFAVESAHASADTGATLTVNLASGEQVQIGLTTASQVTFSRNRYHRALIHDSPSTARLTGISPGVAAADRWYWSQVKGYAAAFADLTLLAGHRVMPGIDQDGTVESFKRRLQIVTTGSVLTAAFSIGGQVVNSDGTAIGIAVGMSASVTKVYDITGGIANNGPDIGVCVKANASTEFALIDLMIQ